MRTATFAAIGLGTALAVSSAAAQERWDLSCRDRDHSDWGRGYCDIQEQTIRPGRGAIRVNAHPNGGVTVIGWDRDEIVLRSKITARARTEDRAEEIGREVRVRVRGTEIDADGPESRNREWWSVSFELRVPRNSDLWVRAHNGGIEVAEVKGDIDLGTTNGGLSLRALGGNVRGQTTNGGVDVELVGREWDGRGLDVETTNGGIDLTVPDRYSADLETGTVNGGLEIDFPIQVRGRLSKQINTKLGDGGAPIRAVTTNGGVSIRRG
jgi:hypothetical protein